MGILPVQSIKAQVSQDTYSPSQEHYQKAQQKIMKKYRKKYLDTLVLQGRILYAVSMLVFSTQKEPV
ncbi:hypothetical protein C7B61_03045 [filamentous cyanobacterium CCP1]|nr:hypothetical protein C7B76_04500 [filamentous cyanobacterium CCP2]PSB68027.1 hypothetical protein C7B61_03045 [filamentous cyanobacterium CCP1]